MKGDGWILAAIGFLAAGCVILGFYASADFAKHCAKLGGHVVTLTSTGTGTDSKGKPVVTVNDTDLCLSSDGRILDHG